MTSCLYEGLVMHARLSPIDHRFQFPLFMFYLDLDDVGGLSRRHRLLGYNRFNLFSFRDEDHLGSGPGTVREKLQRLLAEHGVGDRVAKVMLLTHLRTLGHVFNPVSFYFCFDAQGKPVCAVSEVENTFHEKKSYVLAPDTWVGGRFRYRVPKYFYVSPFIALDASFDFNLAPPDDEIQLFVDDYEDGHRFFASSFVGKRWALSDARLLWYALRFPFITLQVLALIHWQALTLWIKKLPYYRKADRPDLQREIIHAKHTY